MKISYDLETDSLYIRLLEGQYECRTLRLNEDVALNIGPGETFLSGSQAPAWEPLSCKLQLARYS